MNVEDFKALKEGDIVSLNAEVLGFSGFRFFFSEDNITPWLAHVSSSCEGYRAVVCENIEAMMFLGAINNGERHVLKFLRGEKVVWIPCYEGNFLGSFGHFLLGLTKINP